MLPQPTQGYFLNLVSSDLGFYLQTGCNRLFLMIYFSLRIFSELSGNRNHCMKHVWSSLKYLILILLHFIFFSDKDGRHQTQRSLFYFSSTQVNPAVILFPKCGAHRDVFYYNIYLCVCGERFPLKLLMHHFHHSAQREES